MLRQVTIERALKYYLEGNKEIKIIRPVGKEHNMVMTDLEKLFLGSICLVEFSETGDQYNNPETDKSENINIEQIADMSDQKIEISKDGSKHVAIHSNDGKRRSVDVGKLKSLLAAKWKAKDIAEELNISVATVYSYSRRLKHMEENNKQ